MSKLELRHLRTLTALRSTGSLIRAAQLLNLTQSALSHQVKLLEEVYGVALFERKSVPIVFTATGNRLLQLAEAVLPLVDDAERDAARMSQASAGQLRVALECHTCFDWLMPVMDEFRRRWPEVEVDLVSGFHSDPAKLLRTGKADLVIGSERLSSRDYVEFPLFRFEIMAVLPLKHGLQARKRLEARDFEGETLITYPVPGERIDLIREILKPAGIGFTRRTAELTVAIVQLVASRRGLAALPSWGLKNYVDYDYILAKRIGARGLWSDLYVSVPQAMGDRPFVHDFVNVIRDQCAATLDGIQLLGAGDAQSASRERPQSA
ncbi:MAG: LysR family transcriptional regulator [Noviherbaspirillum sp.]